MHYQTFPPPAALAHYVRFFWVLEAEVAPNDFYIHRAMADGCAELLFHYKGTFDEMLDGEKTERSFLSGIHGQAQTFRRFRINESFGIFGVYLYPHALPHFFDLPASEFSNQMPDLRCLSNNRGTRLEEEVMTAGNNEQRIDILCSFFASRLAKKQKSPHHLELAIQSIIQNSGRVSVEALASQHCLSKRHFERKFKELSGFSPKLYTRIVRFQSVFRELNVTRPSLTEVAHQCGYYDQSHFIHDFKEFSGFNPREFLHEDNSECINWAV